MNGKLFGYFNKTKTVNKIFYSKKNCFIYLFIFLLVAKHFSYSFSLTNTEMTKAGIKMKQLNILYMKKKDLQNCSTVSIFYAKQCLFYMERIRQTQCIFQAKESDSEH